MNAAPIVFARSLLVLLLAAPLASLAAENWPAWRGPSGQGLTSETDLPLEWGPERNVRWKLPLPAPGNSTPIIWSSRIFITQGTVDGKKRALHCLDRRDGKELWKRELSFEGEEPTHADNLYCSASPATDGERVVVSHGSAGVHCYDLEGKPLWSRDLGSFRHIWGNAASPVFEGGLCFLNCGPGPRSFLIALDKKSGETRWQLDVDGGLEGGDPKTWTGSWSTPLIVEEGGKKLLLASYPGALRAVEPASGKEIWRCEGLGKLVYTSPLCREGVAVAMSGFQGPPMAVRTGGAGDVTATHRLWRNASGPQRIGSGVIHEGRIYIVNDSGAAECLDLKTGARVWHERLGATSWSSVVLAGARIYALDQEGTGHVFRAAPKFEVLARNELGERTRASIAVSDGELFIRTYKHLWCIAGAK
jgi:outer membrane protein assembly factor BamB